MDDTQKLNQLNSQSIGVAVPVGGVERAPMVIEAPIKPPEISVEVTPSEVEPVISGEEKEAGVVAHPPEPVLDPDAKAVGVVESIPSPLNFIPPAFDSVKAAEQVANSTSQAFSLAWIAEIIAKNLKRFKQPQPQEVN